MILKIVVILIVLVVLYFLAMMPRVINKPDLTPFKQKLFAHRGLHDNETNAPENSMAAFKKAVDAGYGIELDVQLTKDMIPVVFHDFTLKRICGVEGKVIDYTYEELQQFPLAKSQERIPKFEDFLKLVDGKVPLIVEIKVDKGDLRVCPLADEMLRQYKGIYCMESFDPRALIWYRNHHSSVMRGQLSMEYLKEKEYNGPLFWILENMLLNFLTRPDFIAFDCRHYKFFARRVCRNIYKNKAAAWTVKSKEQLAQIRSEFDVYIFDSFVPDHVE